MRDNEIIPVQKLSKTAQLIAEDELRESENNKKQALAIMKQWIEKNPQLISCRTDDNFILRFLRIRKFNVPMAQHNLVKYLNFRQSLSHLTFNLDYRESKVAELINSGYIFASPVRDSAGRRVIIALSEKLNPHKYTRIEMAKAHAIAYETVLEDEETQVMGITHFADMKGLGMSHISLWTPYELAVVLRIGEQAVPMRHKAIHLINFPPAFRYVFEFAVSRVSEKMKERVRAGGRFGYVLVGSFVWNTEFLFNLTDRPREMGNGKVQCQTSRPKVNLCIPMKNPHFDWQIPVHFGCYVIGFQFYYGVSNKNFFCDNYLVHDSLSDLHKSLDNRCLPKEYGGTIPLADMIDMWKEELSRSRHRLLALDKMKSLVPIKRRNRVDALEGSFKKLEID